MLAGPALAQADVEPITITRDLAQAVNEAIQTLVQNPGSPEVYTKEACWRDLRSRRWSHVQALQNKISNFLSTQGTDLEVTDQEWSLIENVIECVEAILALAANDPKKAFERAMQAFALAKLDPHASAVLGRAGALGTEEQPLAVRKYEVAPVGAVRAVFGAVSFDGQLRAGLE